MSQVSHAIAKLADSTQERLNRTVIDIKRDFRDGVNMILLVGMLEGRYCDTCGV